MSVKPCKKLAIPLVARQLGERTVLTVVSDMSPGAALELYVDKTLSREEVLQGLDLLKDVILEDAQ